MDQTGRYSPPIRPIASVAFILLGVAAMPNGARANDCEDAAQEEARSAIDRLLADGAAGVEIRLGRNEDSVVLRGGVEQIGRPKPFPREGRFRAFSTTKTFTAVVVLQQVAEGKIVLDAPIESYLPNLLPAGDRITVRMLLQQTSGLHDYANVLQPDDRAAVRDRYVTYSPAQLVAASVARPLDFEPGERHEYSNTNYIVLGMLIERIAGRSYAHEVYRRILAPLELDDTFVPTTSPFIPGPHGHGYLDPGDGLVDITHYNPSLFYAAAAIISTTADVDAFFHALLNGELLGPEQLREMQNVTPSERLIYDGYGLGLYRMTTACGRQIWGHGGGGLGYFTFPLSTLDGSRRITVLITIGRQAPDLQTVFDLFDAYFCAE